MAKECANCGCKVGFLSGEHFDGLLCDKCYNEFGGMSIISLDTESDANKYLECYNRIRTEIDKKVKKDNDKERIVGAFYNLINSKYKRLTGLGMDEFLQKKRAKEEKELKRVNYAKSFNEFYEYDVVTIINKNHGTVDKSQMMDILSEHARNGWRLHTIYSNELGKNALSLLGFGVNATACEDVLIFERRIPEID